MTSRNNDLTLAQAEFAFNNMQNRSTGKSPFEIVYTKLPRLTVDLADIPSSVDFSLEAEQMAERITKLHQEVHKHIEEANAKYKAKADRKGREVDFKEGDLIMVHLSKGRLPTGSAPKLQKKKFGPYEVLQRYGPNAYKIKLPPNFNINPIFNVVDIYPYEAPDTFTLAT